MQKACCLKGIKFYGMIGATYRNNGRYTGNLVTLQNELKKDLKVLKFLFGFSTFVPKANTPFQWFWQRECKISGREKSNYLRKRIAQTWHSS